MFISILIQSIISVVIILVIHHLYIYFKETLTTPKVKDLVNKPTLRYNDMYDIIKGKSHTQPQPQTSTPISYSKSSSSGSSSMKNELKSYMKSLLNKKNASQKQIEQKHEQALNPHYNNMMRNAIHNTPKNINQLQQNETIERYQDNFMGSF